MKRVLLVDDDPFILRAYQQGLEQHGFQVETANEGLTAMRTLRAAPPDAVVLDLMMPKFSGLEVLRFIRSQTDLCELPVVVLSNAYMEEMSRAAETIGVQWILPKEHGTPVTLAEAIDAAIAGVVMPPTGLDITPASVAPAETPPSPPLAEPPPVPLEAPPPQAPREDPGFRARARQDFLAGAENHCAMLRTLFEAFCSANSDSEKNRRLNDLYRKVHFLTAAAGLVECRALSLLATVLEAMLAKLLDRPTPAGVSSVQTMRQAIDLFPALFQSPRDPLEGPPSDCQVLSVDDDPFSNRVAAGAFQLAKMSFQSTEDPLTAWRWVNEKQFDLVLLDIEMPFLRGFEFSRQLRGLPKYRNTPVIFVTAHSEFENRAEGVLSGGDDLIAKPIFPMELVVKAVSHLLTRRLED